MPPLKGTISRGHQERVALGMQLVKGNEQHEPIIRWAEQLQPGKRQPALIDIVLRGLGIPIYTPSVPEIKEERFDELEHELGQAHSMIDELKSTLNDMTDWARRVNLELDNLRTNGVQIQVGALSLVSDDELDENSAQRRLEAMHSNGW